mmetsp:Transcript_22693/g.37510  ORF Transcript_22693/g.37510 Transcript_22693/m.37510 type:complete len:298 (+) Transcript_22693:312-1205(+)
MVWKPRNGSATNSSSLPPLSMGTSTRSLRSRASGSWAVGGSLSSRPMANSSRAAARRRTSRRAKGVSVRWRESSAPSASKPSTAPLMVKPLLQSVKKVATRSCTLHRSATHRWMKNMRSCSLPEQTWQNSAASRAFAGSGIFGPSTRLTRRLSSSSATLVVLAAEVSPAPHPTASTTVLSCRASTNCFRAAILAVWWRRRLCTKCWPSSNGTEMCTTVDTPTSWRTRQWRSLSRVPGSTVPNGCGRMRRASSRLHSTRTARSTARTICGTPTGSVSLTSKKAGTTSSLTGRTSVFSR